MQLCGVVCGCTWVWGLQVLQLAAHRCGCSDWRMVLSPVMHYVVWRVLLLSHCGGD